MVFHLIFHVLANGILSVLCVNTCIIAHKAYQDHPEDGYLRIGRIVVGNLYLLITREGKGECITCKLGIILTNKSQGTVLTWSNNEHLHLGLRHSASATPVLFFS